MRKEIFLALVAALFQACDGQTFCTTSGYPTVGLTRSSNDQMTDGTNTYTAVDKNPFKPQNSWADTYTGRTGNPLCECQAGNTRYVLNGPSAPTQTVICTTLSATANVNGDPHFVGFDGYKFDLQGEHNTSYSFVSHKGVQANIKLVRCGDVFNGREWVSHSNSTSINKISTWIGGFGVKHNGDALRIEKLEDRTIVVEVNGEAVLFNSSVAAHGGMVVRYGSKTCDAASKKIYGIPTVTHVWVDTELFSFSVPIPHNFARRMDVSVQLYRSIHELEGTVEGLVGATVRAKHPLGATSMEQVYPDTTAVLDDAGNEFFKLSPTVEAEVAAAYTVSDLLAHDAVTNMFDPEIARSVRRSLITASSQGQSMGTRTVFASASGGSSR